MFQILSNLTTQPTYHQTLLLPRRLVFWLQNTRTKRSSSRKCRTSSEHSLLTKCCQTPRTQNGYITHSLLTVKQLRLNIMIQQATKPTTHCTGQLFKMAASV